MSEPWRHRAACLNKDTDYWFPDAYGAVGPGVKRALALCGGCEVRTQCLQWALDKPEIHGIWGGLTERERASLRRLPEKIRHGTNSGYETHLRYGQQACQACRTAHSQYQNARRRIRQRQATRHTIEEVS